MGVVIATCCSNKLSLDDFRESRVQEFCDLNSRPCAFDVWWHTTRV